jgi:RNA ligase (TIGR02306 family)
MERHLVTIQRILALNPIPNADKIEQATILGWSLVVPKGDFKVGDLCVYCEVDSILPDKPEFEFLRTRRFRIKTIRLKGVISQGIAFPLSILKDSCLIVPQVTEGQDVTDLLGVTKFEIPIPVCMSGIMKGNFPGFIPKTDEERIQNIPWILDVYHNQGPFNYTEKLDGTSATYYIKDGIFGVCSRNIDLARPEPDVSAKDKILNVFWKVANELHLEDNMKRLGDNFAIQGEIIGPGIRQNRYGLNEHRIYIYNVFDIATGKYADVHAIDIIKALGLVSVPLVSITKTLPPDIETLVKFATIQSIIAPSILIEGMVIRPKYNINDARIGRLSFKVLNPEYLLKYGD